MANEDWHRQGSVRDADKSLIVGKTGKEVKRIEGGTGKLRVWRGRYIASAIHSLEGTIERGQQCDR